MTTTRRRHHLGGLLRRLPRWLPRRLRPDDDRGSMAMYLVIAVTGLAIGALLVPMIVTSSQTTRSDTSRGHAIDAAQAGLNVALGQIRAAQVGGVGTTTMLPCTSTTGVVNGTGVASYTVSIDYYMSNPVTDPTALKMSCVDGYGTYDPVTDGFTPRYARITSVGKDGPAGRGTTRGRTLKATYVFRTSNLNITGGRIRIFPGSSNPGQFCMDAGSGTPSAGTAVILRPCIDRPEPEQTFAYRSDLTVQLLSSVTATYPDGLCLDTAAPPTAGQAVVLNACGRLGTPAGYTQQWSFNDDGHLEASLAASATNGQLSNMCVHVASQNAGVPVVIQGCAGSTTDPRQAWIPQPSVGPGAAEPPQLINYYEFGRCLDVTNQNVNSDHLIDYPCKQNPLKTAVTWNQKFTLPAIPTGATNATGRIYTTRSGVDYCVTSPGTEGGWPTVVPCSGTDPRQTWTVYNGSNALSYSDKYTIVDSSGRCLGLTDPAYSEEWSAIAVEACSGATEQKWNATPNLISSSLQDITEVPTT